MRLHTCPEESPRPAHTHRCTLTMNCQTLLHRTSSRQELVRPAQQPVTKREHATYVAAE